MDEHMRLKLDRYMYSMAGKSVAQILLAGVAFSALSIAFAQAPAEKYEDLSVEESLQVCAAFNDKDDRLSCFEALAASAGNPSPIAAAKPRQHPAPDSVAEPPVVATAPAPDAEEAPANAAEPSNVAPRFTFLRKDPVRESKRNRKRYETTVYRAWRNPVGELRIAMINGDIWVQAGRGVRYTPESGEKVVLKPGLAGGWTISMDDGKAGVRARLLQSEAE
jgi:hypothetical protein